MSLATQVVESGKALVVRRVVDGVFEASSSMLGAAPSSEIVATGAPGFSVGATAFIALTSAALGGMAGWALHDMFSSKRK